MTWEPNYDGSDLNISTNRNKVFSPKINQFDEAKLAEELKNCHKIVKDYIKLLQQHSDNWKDIAQKAISKLRSEGIIQQVIKKANQNSSPFDQE